MRKIIFLVSLACLPLQAFATQAVWEYSNNTQYVVHDDGNLLRRHSLEAGEEKGVARFELNAEVVAGSQELKLLVEPAIEGISLQVRDARGRSLPVSVEEGGRFVEVTAGEFEYVKFDGVSGDLPFKKKGEQPRRVEIRFPAEQAPRKITLDLTPYEEPAEVDLAPRINAARGAPLDVAPSVEKVGEGFKVVHPRFEALFSLANGLKWESLLHRIAGEEVLRYPAESAIFIIEYEGKRVPAKDWEVGDLQLDGAQARVTLRHAELEATLTIGAEEGGLKMGLSMASAGKRPWKTVFPHISGLQLSTNASEDYYLFPYFGGIIHTSNANLRSLYGMRSAWWQMLSLFSPEKGAAVSLRVLDADGIPKGIALRKGMRNPAYANLQMDLGKRVGADYLWQQSLEPSQGMAFAVEYSRHLISSAMKAEYPPALLDLYAGDWKPAMQAYAKWATEAWQWQEPKMQDRWNLRSLSMLKPVRSSSRLLYSDGEWYADYRKDGVDVGEFLFWWKWSPVGPFGVDLRNASKEAGPTFYNRFKYFFDQVDPATGESAYMVNDGDYAFNPSMGGQAGLREGVATAHREGALVQLYTCPFLADNNTELGRAYGRKYGVYNIDLPPLPADVLPGAPRDGYFISYGKWRMCLDAKGYQELLVERMSRMAHETGADLIRFDVMGTSGEACHNPLHEHRFGGDGDLGGMRGSKYVVDEVRKRAAKEGRPDLMISAEYPGADFLSASLNSVLTYETEKWVLEGLRPLPVNLFRFAFPHIKYFDLIDHRKEVPLYPAVPFFNGVGLFSKNYPPELHQLLKENSDAIGGASVEPLVPTLVSRLYANRFDAAGKSVVLFYNDTGKALNGALFPAEAGRRYFDLLNGRELSVKDGGVIMEVKESGALLIVKDPAVVERAADGVSVTFRQPLENGRIILCDREGKELEKHTVENQSMRLAGKHGYVKVFDGAYLVDAFDLSQPLLTKP